MDTKTREKLEAGIRSVSLVFGKEGVAEAGEAQSAVVRMKDSQKPFVMVVSGKRAVVVRTASLLGMKDRAEKSLERMAVEVAAIRAVIDRMEVAERFENLRPGGDGLTEVEEALLARGDLATEWKGPEEQSPIARTMAEYAVILDRALSVTEAATLLGITPARVRQRVNASPQTLYGVKLSGEWKLPRFQFQLRTKRLVPGIEVVIQEIPESLDPVSVVRWFTSPNPDLQIDDAEAVSPVDWLATGHEPAVAAALAREL